MAKKNPLLTPMIRILHQHPAGLSEFSLLKILEADGLELATESEVSPDLLLFRKHFLIMNALYQLQPILQEEGFYLSISALHIQLTQTDSATEPPNSTNLSKNKLSKADHLRDYYLDWSEFEKSSSEYVNKLLASFWRCYLGEEHLKQAWTTLELEPGTPVPLVRKAYQRLARRHHPDQGGDAEQFRRVREAYELLVI